MYSGVIFNQVTPQLNRVYAKNTTKLSVHVDGDPERPRKMPLVTDDALTSHLHGGSQCDAANV